MTDPFDPDVRNVLAQLHGRSVAHCMAVIGEVAVHCLLLLPDEDAQLDMLRGFTSAVTIAVWEGPDLHGHA